MPTAAGDRCSAAKKTSRSPSAAPKNAAAASTGSQSRTRKNHENCAGKGFFVELHDDSSFAAKGSCVIGLKAEALHLDVLFFQLMIDLFRVGFVVKRKCVRQGLYGVFEVRERGAVIVILQDL